MIKKANKMSNRYIKNFLIEKKLIFNNVYCVLCNDWKGGLVTIFTIEKLGRGVYPIGRNLNSRILTRLTTEKLWRGVYPIMPLIKHPKFVGENFYH